MSVIVILPNEEKSETTPVAMAELSNELFPVSARVPGTVGEGFDLLKWYRAYVRLNVADGNPTPEEPTHLIVRAADEFQATIPWQQLDNALFQYAIDGQPLVKGKPLRLYVPDGTSACLNVKSVVSIRFATDAALGEEAKYGFLNEVSPDLMIKGLKTR
ncbi:molybdopterin-dependent oxidoreductase [Cohnella cholangitidis]|uniref:Oxidoreductase molybdopterin-binding domain-containing protein n=1 Tax=Cohnella cholangitidis TaxID=2598458 RepID=A0A7G5C3B9_9BACL|nr:molybdopterin-dependent oxidoreductase [Cohnella cholangitidis]QMV43703.1 hypothetical protein FPL14_22905 [Cohnella cholangitidis]